MISRAFLQLMQDGKLQPPDCWDTMLAGTLDGPHVRAYTCHEPVATIWEPLGPVHLTLLCSHLDGMWRDFGSGALLNGCNIFSPVKKST